MYTRTTPKDDIVAEMLALLSERQREEFEERAAIMEFDGQLTRGHAECLALLGLLHRHSSSVAGISALQIELDGATQWLLTTDPDFARAYLADIAGVEIATVDPLEIIRDQYGGVAVLSTLG